MPIINNRDLTDVIVQFGTGDILITHGDYPEEEWSHIKEIILIPQQVKRPIGEYMPEDVFAEKYKGKRTEELPEFKVRLQFSAKESVQVLIEELTKTLSFMED